MSLEEAIQENTLAIGQLIMVLRAGSPVVLPGKPAPTNAAVPVKMAETAQTAEAQAVQTVSYNLPKAVILKIAEVAGRDASQKLIANVQPGATKLPDVKPELWAAVVEQGVTLITEKLKGDRAKVLAELQAAATKLDAVK
jgi:hypothetical protein